MATGYYCETCGGKAEDGVYTELIVPTGRGSKCCLRALACCKIGVRVLVLVVELVARSE